MILIICISKIVSPAIKELIIVNRDSLSAGLQGNQAFHPSELFLFLSYFILFNLLSYFSVLQCNNYMYWFNCLVDSTRGQYSDNQFLSPGRQT